MTHRKEINELAARLYRNGSGADFTKAPPTVQQHYRRLAMMAIQWTGERIFALYGEKGGSARDIVGINIRKLLLDMGLSEEAERELRRGNGQ